MLGIDPKKIGENLVKGKWDEAEFTIGKTSFRVERIGAIQEDAMIDDFLEEVGLRSVQELRFLFVDNEALRAQAVVQMFLKLSKEYKRRLRDTMFQYVRYKHKDSNQFKPIRGPDATPGTNELEADAFQHLRGGHVQIVFYRSLWATFRDSFSNPV